MREIGLLAMGVASKNGGGVCGVDRPVLKQREGNWV